MPTVWAHFSGSAGEPGFRNFGLLDESPAHGWSHVHNFDTLDELISWLRESNLYGEVARLNIHCHGRPGRLMLDFTVSMANAERLDGLGVYLRRDAKLIFTGCNVGMDQPGTAFLADLSVRHWGRKIIGFELVSILGHPSSPHWQAGDITYGSGISSGVLARSGHIAPPGRAAKDPRVTPWNVHSKWAFRGTILRYPAHEQARRSGRRCASPTCPGHHAPWEQCHAWHPGCEW
jgi:hypothetical protein